MKTAVTFCGSDEGSKCGYCHSSYGMKTVGMLTPRLTPQLYQDLIDRGWRRSGTYCYRPRMKETCCPMYTIRCDAQLFQLSKSHRRLLRRVRDFLISGVRPKVVSGKHQGIDKSNPSSTSELSKTQARGDVSWCMEQSPSGDNPSKYSKSNISHSKNIQKSPRITKAKYIRWQRKLEHFKKLAETRSCSFDDILKDYEQRRSVRLMKNRQKTLEELLQCEGPSVKHRISIRLVRSHPPSQEFKDTVKASHEVYKSYQQVIHGDPSSKVTVDQWENFLVSSPLFATNFKGKLPKYDSLGFGSFHMQYWLDEKELIAVGVIDILPSCLSSVYFYYNPHYGFLQLGTYSALREIALVREMMVVEPQLHFYYLGYYIHTCPKMRYKGQYHPSFLACPETFQWVPLLQCRRLLDHSKYARLLHGNSSTKDEEALTSESDLENFVIFDTRRLGIGGNSGASSTMLYGDFKRMFNISNIPTVKEFGETVGRKCIQKMILSL